jgi:hypothetical protein
MDYLVYTLCMLQAKAAAVAVVPASPVLAQAVQLVGAWTPQTMLGVAVAQT